MVVLSNVTLSNDIYSFSSNNGFIKLEQFPTVSSVLQYTAYLTYGSSNATQLLYGDSYSNVSITHSNYSSNNTLYLGLNNSNIYTYSNVPYLSTSNAYNTFQMNLSSSNFNILVNNSNLLNVNTFSNQIPQSYNENADILLYGSSNMKIKDIVYQPTAMVTAPMTFTEPVKFASLSAMSIRESNVPLETKYALSNSLSNYLLQSTATTTYAPSNAMSNYVLQSTANTTYAPSN